MQRAIGWFLLCLLGVAATSGLAGHAPARVRLLLLFPLAFGLLVGSAASCLAIGLELRRSIGAALVSALLTIAGLANVARIASGELAAQARRAVQEDPQQLLALRLLESSDMRDPRNLRSYHELRAALQPTFGDYLASRLAGTLGWRPTPWPELAWGCEVLVAGIAAAWTTWRLMSGAGRVPSSSKVHPPGQIEP
jgi:hypothetical protein